MNRRAPRRVQLPAILALLIDFRFTLPVIDGYVYSTRPLKLIHVDIIHFNKDDESMIDWHVDGRFVLSRPELLR